MAIGINNYSASMFGANQLSKINSAMATSQQRLSTGLRINVASDDPAGLAISAKFKAQIGSWGVVQKNMSNGLSLVGAAEKALGNVNDILQQMREIAQQASNDDLSADQRTNLSNTFTELQGQIDTIVNGAEVNGKNLIAAAGANVVVQSGIKAGDTYTLTSVAMTGTDLSIDSGSEDITSAANARAAMTAIDTAIDTVSGNQATFGARMKGLEIMSDNASDMKASIEKARSRIEDTDIAEESAKLSKLQIQQQATVSMLGVANQSSQALLGLLRF